MNSANNSYEKNAFENFLTTIFNELGISRGVFGDRKKGEMNLKKFSCTFFLKNLDSNGEKILV